jgi:hypothetical protein
MEIMALPLMAIVSALSVIQQSEQSLLAHCHDISSRYLKLYHDSYIYDPHNRYWINW